MKVIEVLKFNRELINNLRLAGIRLDDAKYIDLYYDYKDMLSRGEKVTYIVAVLAGSYGICERKVYDLIRRFKSDCVTSPHRGGECLTAVSCLQHEHRLSPLSPFLLTLPLS